MEKITIKRDGLPPLVFTGKLLSRGSNDVGHNGHQNRWTTVRIYRTQAGKYIGEIGHYTQWQGESETIKAASHASAAELIEWLKEGEATLGGVSQEAVEKAAAEDPEFAKVWVEEVE